MKNVYILMFLLFSTVFHAQVVNIPDSNFKNALIDEGVDTNNDGEIQISEAEAVINLNVNGRNISSLEGIQSFINLEVLHCSNNQLSTLDMSQNVNLQKLICNSNQLNNLNVTQNSNLEFLWCQDNQLSVLDVSQNLNLEALRCAYNLLGSIDITQNLNLLILDCGNNQLTALDVSNNTNLERLSFDNNLISSIDISQNLNLQVLTCSHNSLSQLDLSQHGALEYLMCMDNQLIGLFIDNGNNQNLSTMISTGNPALTCIQVDDKNATYPECDGLPIVGWCIDPWTSYSEFCRLGLVGFEYVNLRIYPNPVQNKLFLSMENSIENLKTKIFNIDGKLMNVRHFVIDNQFSIDVSKLPSGMYFLNIEDEKGNTTNRKFIKE